MKVNVLFWSIRRALAGDRGATELIDDAGFRIAVWESVGVWW